MEHLVFGKTKFETGGSWNTWFLGRLSLKLGLVEHLAFGKTKFETGACGTPGFGKTKFES